MSHRDAQRSKQPEVIAIHIFRHQFVAMPDVDGNRIVGHRPTQLHRKHRKRFAQAERGSEVLAEFEKSLRFLACRCDRTEKTALRRPLLPLRLESCGRLDDRHRILVFVFDFR